MTGSIRNITSACFRSTEQRKNSFYWYWYMCSSYCCRKCRKEIMEQIHVNMDVLLPAGYSEYVIDTQRDIELTFFAKEDSDVYIRIINAKKINIRTFAESNKCSVFNSECYEEENHADESHEVLANAHVTVAYGEWEWCRNNVRNTFVALRQESSFHCTCYKCFFS